MTEKYDPNAALKFAEAQVGTKAYNDMCQKFVENAYGRSGVYSSAKAAYNDAAKKGTLQTGTLPPAGAAVYFQGNKKYGHVAISAGNGYMISSGIGGKVQKVKINDLSKMWGAKGSYLGWSDPSGSLKGGSPFAASAPSSPGAPSSSSVGANPNASRQFRPTIAAPVRTTQVF